MLTENDISHSMYSHFKLYDNVEDKINFLEIYFGRKLKWYQKAYMKLILSNTKPHEENYLIYDEYIKRYNAIKEKENKHK